MTCMPAITMFIPDYRLGNVLNDNLGEIVGQSLSRGFGSHKETMLPNFVSNVKSRKPVEMVAPSIALQ